MRDSQRSVQRFVVKVGSSVLTDETGRLIPGRLERLVDQIAASSGREAEPILVSSGAIACGMAKLGLTRRPTALPQLQACAAVGQSELMHRYARAFEGHGLHAAQVLLTQDDLSDKGRFRNATQTLTTLLRHRVVPVVNENDTVAVEEITFGDNDRLAALVAAAVDAQLLLILSDVDGLLQDGRLVERVETVDSARPAVARGTRRHTTKGGMGSKLEAARIAGHSGIPMILANGLHPDIVPDVLGGKPLGTLFVPPRNRLQSRKWWIAFSLRQPKGALVIDAGAAEAVSEKGKSLLLPGVTAVRGTFQVGSFVAITTETGTELARGVCNFSSAELMRVLGMKSPEAAKTLGRARTREVIHRDHLVLAQEMRH